MGVNRVLRIYGLAGLCAITLAGLPQGHALPAMPVTEQGSASVNISGNRMDITQHSDLLISRHSQYDVGAAESVVYLQPSSSALAIAKIDGGMSQILGHISANGRLWLVNSNGFFVGQNASIDTAGLMLASHSLQQDSAGFRLQQGPGSITNLGSITVQGDGQLTLLSRQVDNQGLLSSGGDLLINTGERLLLQPKGQGFAIEVQQNSNTGQISNSGNMQGHYIVLNAERDISSAEITINNTGNISAVAVLESDGEVYLRARGASLIQDGTVQATGGLIDIHAATYLQQGQLETSAAPGQNGNGGTVNLWADKGFELSGSSRIAANASGYGNGGQLNLISPGYALLHSGGWLSARGGELGGNGGFAELSGWQFVMSNGLADMRAPKGAAGTYLIDPYNIEIISGSADINTTFGAGSYTASNTPAQIGADNITTQLGLGNVIIDTTGAGVENGDITITGVIDLTGSNGNNLTFTADGSIAINNDLTNSADSTNISMVAGGNITFLAGSQMDAGAGTISLTAGGIAQLSNGSLQTSSASNSAVSIITNGSLSGSNDDSADIIASNGGVDLTAGNISNLELNVDRAALSTTNISGISLIVQNDLEITALSLLPSSPLGISGFSSNANLMGTLTLPTSGITISGALNLYTTDIIDGDGGDVLIDNSTASYIEMDNPAAARAFELGTGSTSFVIGNAQNLTATNSNGNLRAGGVFNTGNLTLSSSGNLQINNVTGADSLSATATGSITIPDAGLSTTSAITLSGSDIIDSTAPRAITLNTTSLDVTTALSGGDTSIDTTATSLAVYKGLVTTDSLTINKTDAGDLTVSTVDSGNGGLVLNLNNGDLIISNTRLESTDSLTVVANDIHDSDRIVTLNGTLLDITLNGTNVNGLTLRGLANTNVAIAGTSATDLTLLSGTGSFTVTSMANWAGDVTLDAASRITIPDTGISSTGTITVNAGYLRSASSGTSATLNGGFGLVLDLGLGNGSATVNTTSLFGTITTSGTSNTLTLNKTDAGDFTLNSASISAGGLNIALTDGTLTLPGTITVPGTLTLNANDVNDITLSGGSLDLTLDALADALTLNTTLDNATINISGAAQNFVLNETDDLNLSSFTSTGNVNITSGGALTIADTGLSSSGTLTLDVGDIHDSDRSVILNGSIGLTINTDLSGGNSTINTTNSSAALSTTSANTLSVNKTDAGDFTLNSASISAGGLNIALTNGTLTLPASITVPGTLTINAHDVNDITLSGGSLDLTLDALADALTLNTTLDNATINISGAAQNFVLNETDDLNLSSFTSTGNVNITSGGALTIADTGLSSSGTLTLDVADIHDSDRSVILNGSTGLTINTDLSGGNSTINTTNSSAALDTTSANTLTLNKTDAGDFTLNSASISAGGLNISLTNGTLTLPGTITVPGTLTLNANDVNDITLSGGTLDLTLDALADALSLNTTLSSAAINISGASQVFTLNETNGLTLSSLNSSGDTIITTGGAFGSSATLNCTGLCSINSAGLSTDLTVSSADFLLVDSGNNQTRSISSSAQNNDVAFSGSNNALTLNLAANGHLNDLNSDNFALNITDGHATLNFAGDGFIDSALNIADAGNDGTRYGWLNIVYGSALDINANIDVSSTFESITSGLPQDSSNSYAGLLVLENQGSGVLTLAAGTQLTSTGGDVVLDILGSEGNYSAMVMGSGSAINALNAPADSSTAIDSAAPYASQLLAASGRTIYLLPDESNPPIVPGPDINEIIDEALTGAEETQIQDQPAGNSAAEEIISSTQQSLDNNPNLSFAMEAIFNRCTQQNSDKCELKKELSRFLGQYLIGGSMPKAKR